jgi:hypothetical protein
MNDGRLADCLLALNILDIRLVFVSRAAYTTVKQKPAQNLSNREWVTNKKKKKSNNTNENEWTTISNEIVSP